MPPPRRRDRPGRRATIELDRGEEVPRVPFPEPIAEPPVSLAPRWPLVATNVADMDEGTPNTQWTDTSGDVPPSGTWYYQVTAYSASCAAEGPF